MLDSSRSRRADRRPEETNVTAPASIGLARLTVSTQRGRLDIALPENLPVAELLPHILRHAGEGVADDGEKHGGWVLRQTTGVALNSARSLAAQGVRDGVVLHLAPTREQWPEPEYDDVVEIIASGSRRTGRSWGKVATRWCGLTVTAVVLGLGLIGVLTAGPPWPAPGGFAVGFAALAMLVALVLSRAYADAVAGAVVGGCALAYAAAGGFLVTGPPVTIGRLGAPQVLFGGTALLVFGIVGYVGVAALGRLYVAAIAIGAIGAFAAALCYLGMSATGAGAAALTIAIGLLPGYPVISVWLGKLPIPALPERPEEMLVDRPVPKRSGVFTAVTRTHEILTGLLLAAAVVSGVGFVVLVRDGSMVALALAIVAAVALLLRARLFPTPWQRIPLIISGLTGAALFASACVRALPHGARLVALLVVVGAVAALVLAAALSLDRRAPSPYLRRFSDIFDVLSILALVPLAGAVVGLYQALQGLFASVA
jgi:type VII secretion integral membrane protein EccD